MHLYTILANTIHKEFGCKISTPPSVREATKVTVFR
jgi:hypothetical protein